VVDRNRPIISRHVPIKFGVIIVVAVEESDAIADAIIEVDHARGIDRSREVDFEIAIGSGFARVILELVSGIVGDADDVEKQRVVGSFWSGIFDRDGAVNALPLAYERKGDLFTDERSAVGGDGDRVFEIADPPAAPLGVAGRC